MFAPLKTIATLFAVGGIGVGVVWFYSPQLIWSQTSPPAVPALAEVDHSIHQLGSIQPAGGIVEVALPAGLRPVRFEKGVAIGSRVTQGEVLAYLDGHDERVGELAVIDAEIKVAEATLRDERENERVSLERIEAERQISREVGELQIELMRKRIDLLKKKSAHSANQLHALDGLQDTQAISFQEFSRQKALQEADQGELECTGIELKRLSLELSHNTGDAKIAEEKRKVKAAAARIRNGVPLDSLQRKKDLALAMLERTQVRAPISGTILEINTRPGEAAVGKPLLKLGDSSQMYVVAEVYEESRYLVRPGQQATITGRGLPDAGKPLRGQVERVGLMVSGRKLMPLDLAAESSSHVFEVWIRLNAEDSARVKDYSLLRVDIQIDH